MQLNCKNQLTGFLLIFFHTHTSLSPEPWPSCTFIVNHPDRPLGVKLCVPVLLIIMLICPNCSLDVSNSSSLPCDACQKPLHLKCIGLSENDVKWTRSKSKAVKVVCSNCNNNISQFKDLKSTIAALQNEIATSITNLRADFEAKLNDLQISINNKQSDRFEDIVTEVTERQNRKQNLIMFGVDEQQVELDQVHSSERDQSSVKDILKCINPSFDDDNIKIQRLGRRSDTKARPIKIILRNDLEVLSFIKNAKTLRNSPEHKKVSISFDKTPRQIDYYKQVKNDMIIRLNNGETNLRIRHVNGIPKIVKSLN